MQLTQIQWEAIEAAHNEGSLDPAAFAQILLLDPVATVEAFASLDGRGLMRKGDDDRYSLTAEGETVHRQREARESAAVKRAAKSWQPR